MSAEVIRVWETVSVGKAMAYSVPHAKIETRLLKVIGVWETLWASYIA